MRRTHTSLCVHEIATRPIHQLSGAEIALIRQRNGQESGIFLYAPREMRLNSAFLARSMRITVSASLGDGPITLHTPPPFTGCFPAECCQVSLAVRKKGAFTPLTRSSTLSFFACKPSFAPEYSQTLPATARIRSESGESYARKPGIQAHISVLIVPVVNLLCAAVSTSAAVLRLNGRWISSLPPTIVPSCAAVVQLSLPAMVVSHDGTHLHADHARLAWRVFSLRRGKVCYPKGGSNTCDLIPIDRAALSREFPRN